MEPKADSPHERFGVAVIGLGNAAKPHVRALADLAAAPHSLVRVSGIYARNAERRAAFAERHAFPAADNAEALIADPRTSMLLLLTPPSERLDYVRMAIAHRKPVLMEKPIARTTAEAEALVAMADAAGVPMGIVLQHRKRRGAIALARMLERGDLGRIGLVRLDVPWWRDQPYYDTPGRGTIARDGGGVLLSQAIHAIDLMLYLAGPVSAVNGLTATTSLHRMETEDVAAAGMRFASGAFGALVATTAAFPGSSEVLCIDGDRGAAELGNGELVIRWRRESGAPIERIDRIERIEDSVASGTGVDPMAFDHAMHRDVIREFVEAVMAGGDAPVPARSVLGVHDLIDALLNSSREGRTIEIPRRQLTRWTR